MTPASHVASPPRNEMTAAQLRRRDLYVRDTFEGRPLNSTEAKGNYATVLKCYSGSEPSWPSARAAQVTILQLLVSLSKFPGPTLSDSVHHKLDEGGRIEFPPGLSGPGTPTP
jgi:hypothetical protein